MSYSLSTTNNYHVKELNSLGWELTICNALFPEGSPCRKILKTKASLGVNLYHYLEKSTSFSDVRDFLEIGGGLGYLMRDFLELNPRLCATSLDISPYLLSKQKEILQKYNVSFLQGDALKKDGDFFSRFDLIVMNENLGDLPALIPNDGQASAYSEELIFYQNKAAYFTRQYNIHFAVREIINIGALTLLENVCRVGVKYVYLNEHSCEATPPESLRELIFLKSAGIPEKISLKGHNEYTIKFSYLQKIAETFNYEVRRGPIADFLPLVLNKRTIATLRLKTPVTAEQEIVQQFINDLYKYEYMIMSK
jgi:Methyltransferase domain